MILNILVILSSLPIITIGAAQTALYYAIGRGVRKEGGIWKDYWSAFRSNFKQATLLWLVFLFAGAVGSCIVFFCTLSNNSGSAFALSIISTFYYLWFGTLIWVFPLQSRFENTVLVTLRNAFYCAISRLPRTIVLLVVNAVPFLLFFVFPNTFVKFSPFLLIAWFSLIARINLLLMKKVFTESVG